MRKVREYPLVTKTGQVCWSVFDILFSESRRKAADAWRKYQRRDNPAGAGKPASPAGSK